MKLEMASTLHPYKLGDWRRREKRLIGPLRSKDIQAVIAETASDGLREFKEATSLLLEETERHGALSASDPEILAKAQNIIDQARDDVGHYKALFEKLDRITHPVNVDILKPFTELEVLASIIEATCIDGWEEQLKLRMNNIYKVFHFTGDKKTAYEALKLQVQLVVAESNKVKEAFARILEALKVEVVPATNEQVKAVEHLRSLQDCVKALNGAIAHARSELDSTNFKYDQFKQELETKQKNLQDLNESLKKKKLYLDLYDDRELPNKIVKMNIASVLGGGLWAAVSYSDIRSVRESIASVERTLPELEKAFQEAGTTKEKWNNFLEKGKELQTSLGTYVQGATQIRQDAEHWREIIKALETEWHVFHSHLINIESSTHMLEGPLAVGIPMRAAFSKVVLVAVDQGSWFGNRPGVLDVLFKIIEKIKKVNNSNSNESEVRDMKTYLEREEKHLAEVKALVDNVHDDPIKLGKIKMPEPLGPN